MLTEAQKRELQQRITDLMVEIEGKGNPAFRKLVWVLIDEQEPENWCMSGIPVTPEAVQRVVA
jgi:4-oxalocrotonate tautomerase